MKPKVYTSIDLNEARSPLVRVVHADEWDLLMNELRYLRGERAAVVAWLRERHVRTMEWDGRINVVSLTYGHAAERIERGEHHREEEP